MDLVLYKAEQPGESSTSFLAAVEETAGRCFANTKVVHGNLLPEDNVYPKGPSVQFYKLFLDDDVRQHFEEYDALVIMEWDVMVAHESSFEQLYHATFGGTEPFWVKGSVLEGTSFHDMAAIADMWHVMGHINGNAIYNNTDPDFVEYVEYTLARWEYEYPYDVALWATISDFPYSWPLWQRYSGKFVTTNLIANVGFNTVDANALSTAVAGDTLFIHGSSVEGGSRSIRTSRHLADKQAAAAPQAACSTACSGSAHGTANGLSVACDGSCETTNRFAGHLCGAGDPDRYGRSCRTCYTDQAAALAAEAELRRDSSAGSEAKHVIMCDNMRPPEALECHSKCSLKTDTICDPTCGTGRHGDYNCNWRDHGMTCRYCFNDVHAALVADQVAKRRGGRVIMCDTHEPPVWRDHADTAMHGVAVSRRLSEEVEDPEDLGETGQSEALADGTDARTRRGWKQGSDDPSREPKWRRRLLSDGRALRDYFNHCSQRCEARFTKTGRVCDTTCSNPTSTSYGTRGCGAGNYGHDCRFCYYSIEAARKADSSDSRVIMCDTMAPPDAYARRRLSASVEEDELGVSEEVRGEEVVDEGEGHDEMRPGEWKGVLGKAGKEPKWRRELSDISSSRMCSSRCPARFNRTGRVCDSTCSNPTSFSYGTRGCGTGNNLGYNCRFCYYSITAARRADDADARVIMCQTMAPPDAYSRRRLSATDLDPDLDIDPDIEAADEEELWGLANGDPIEAASDEWRADEVGESPEEGVDADEGGESGHTLLATMREDELGEMQEMVDGDNGGGDQDERRERERPEKWKGVLRTVGKEPKWRRELSDISSSRMCSSRCPARFNRTGRVCDSTCSNPTSFSYGTRGCGTGNNLGYNCRFCYYSITAARRADDADARVIMCQTMAPPDAYSRRRLSATDLDPDLDPDIEAADEEELEGSEDLISPEEYSFLVQTPFGHGMVEGDICAFMGANSATLGEAEMTVRSVGEFMAGLKVVVAVSEEDLEAFRRTFSGMPGVLVAETQNPRLSALFADVYCGSDTKLIYYMKPGTLLSRAFTAKDTHSPRGDLLVVYGEGRGADYRTLASAEVTSALVGFQAPVFTFGTDLILPPYANSQLRELLVVGTEFDGKPDSQGIAPEVYFEFLDVHEDVSAPEALAALQYSKNPDGVWFLNPQQWVAQHLFKTASIWDIPLVKPRFSCSPAPALDPEVYDLRDELSHQLEAFSHGGTCEAGVMNIPVPPARLRRSPSSQW